MIDALEATITAPVVSFRNPLYAGVQVGLPCPPPATIAGMLAATVGGWDGVPSEIGFGVCFEARGHGTDLETFHPLDGRGRSTIPTPKNREFLADATLTLWFTRDLERWESALRRPLWPLRLGRSQDLAAARVRHVRLVEEDGRQGHAIVPKPLSTAGVLLRLPTVISLDRARTRWDAYRYSARGTEADIPTGLATQDGQGVALLSDLHPAQFEGLTVR